MIVLIPSPLAAASIAVLLACLLTVHAPEANAQAGPTFTDPRRLPAGDDDEARRRTLEEQARELKLREAESQRKAEEERRLREAAEVEEEKARRQAEIERFEKERLEREKIARERELAERKRAEEIAREQAEAEAARLAAEQNRRERAEQIATKMQAHDCPLEIRSLPLTAGRTKISVVSTCRHGQSFELNYGPYSGTYTLDQGGHIDVELDLFLGLEPGVDVVLNDGTTSKTAIETQDLENVYKIAILWTAPVELDLHALEYTAEPRSSGDVWTRRPSNAEESRALSERSGLSHGFLSVPGNISSSPKRVQVYTLWNNHKQRHGNIALLIDYLTRGDLPKPPYCGDGELARIPVKIFRFHPSAGITTEDIVLSPAQCGKPLQSIEQFNPYLIEGLRIRN